MSIKPCEVDSAGSHDEWPVIDENDPPFWDENQRKAKKSSDRGVSRVLRSSPRPCVEQAGSVA